MTIPQNGIGGGMGAMAFVSGMIRFAILSVLLTILLSVFCSLRSVLSLLCTLCNFDATQKRNMRIYLAHICLPPGVAHMHPAHLPAKGRIRTHIPMPVSHGALLIVLVAPAISCQINFNLIKFFLTDKNKWKFLSNKCLKIDSLPNIGRGWDFSKEKVITAVEIFTSICLAPLTLYPSHPLCACVWEFLTLSTEAFFAENPPNTSPSTSKDPWSSH